MMSSNGNMFLTIVCRLWQWRNETVLGDKRWTVQHFCEEIRLDLGDNARWLGSALMQDEVTWGTRRWKAPPMNYLSLMVDGAYHAE